MKPLVSLITPVYNAMPYFRDYLACIAAQTWRPLEFIAVDDGSTDGSYEYILEKQKTFEAAGIALHILRIPHAGQAAAVNAALPLISGEFLTWCDADDILAPDSIEKKTTYLLAHPELGMVRSDGYIIFEDIGKINPLARVSDYQTQNIFDRLFHQTTYYCGAGCYMIRTNLFFKCYPKKQIPLSLEGQNLQLLLPPASRTDCGFLAEKLFSYYVRSSGHSTRKRNYTELKNRIENFAKLRAEILSYCICDRQHYLQENEKIRLSERQRLLLSALNRIREEQKR